jgi:hypothetical protein
VKLGDFDIQFGAWSSIIALSDQCRNGPCYGLTPLSVCADLTTVQPAASLAKTGQNLATNLRAVFDFWSVGHLTSGFWGGKMLLTVVCW